MSPYEEAVLENIDRNLYQLDKLIWKDNLLQLVDLCNHIRTLVKEIQQEQL